MKKNVFIGFSESTVLNLQNVLGGYYDRDTMNDAGSVIHGETVSEKGEESGYTCCEATDASWTCDVADPIGGNPVGSAGPNR
jgi:hypothetical protein